MIFNFCLWSSIAIFLFNIAEVESSGKSKKEQDEDLKKILEECNEKMRRIFRTWERQNDKKTKEEIYKHDCRMEFTNENGRMGTYPNFYLIEKSKQIEKERARIAEKEKKLQQEEDKKVKEFADRLCGSPGFTASRSDVEKTARRAFRLQDRMDDLKWEMCAKKK
jgi:hypothetical protein